MQRWMVMGMAYEQFGKEHIALTKLIENYFGADAAYFDISCLDVARVVLQAVYEKPVRCKDCKKGRPIDETKCPEKYFKTDCVVCECEEVVGDEPMIYGPTHFCSYGESKILRCNK